MACSLAFRGTKRCARGSLIPERVRDEALRVVSGSGLLTSQHLAQEIDLLLKHGISLAERFNAAAGVQHGRMVTPPKTPSDIGKRAARELAGEIHGHLPGPGNAPGAARRMQFPQVEPVILRRP